MAHLVKCTVCGQSFDRDKIPAVKSGARRYAHLKCCPDGERIEIQAPPIDEDLENLESYIKQLLKEDYINARVKKQLKNFKEQYGYSYSGILKSLVYFYEVKKNPIDKANGGIGM